MKLQNILLASTVVALSAALAACGTGESESEGEDVGVAFQGVGGTGANNVAPFAVDTQPLKRATTNAFGITTPSNADPAPLCKDGTVTDTGCTMRPEWESWLNADAANRAWIMKGIAKCAVEPAFFVTTSDSSMSFPGQWPLYQGWKDHALDGQDKRERVSACILTLLNGNNATLNICIIGPGGAPFSDACTDPKINLREGGFFGDLFASTPTAYVVGPNMDTAVDSGRVCTSSSGTSYCCAENNLSCPHHIVRAGSMTGSPVDNYATKRCDSFATSGSFEYCTQFHTTREPGRVYTNVFTTFVPSGT